ncbi:MAG TPA: hypothetical protein VGJ02_11330 [Pyrinomonadaceae bacterium]|jgi:hypothetical protein
MSDEPENTIEDENDGSLKRKIPGLGQYLIGELETIGGVLSGDPLARAEGEFNVEVGSVREKLEEDLTDRSSEPVEDDDQ